MAPTLGSRLWVNGALVAAGDVCIALTDRGFSLGDGLFETMLWDGHQIRFFGDHLARLRHAADELGFILPVPMAEIEAGLNALAHESGDQLGVVRLTLTRGTGPRGLALPDPCEPLLIATLAPYHRVTTPVCLVTAAVTRHAGAPSTRFKTLSYIDNIIALKQARAVGGDDAILLGTTGNVACTSSANLIVRYKDATLTPAVDDGALPGIVRGRLIRSGLVEEARISPAQLRSCQTAAITNALINVREVVQIDGGVCDHDGKWTQSLRDALESSL